MDENAVLIVMMPIRRRSRNMYWATFWTQKTRAISQSGTNLNQIALWNRLLFHPLT